VESVGQVLFFLALGVGLVAAVAWISGLLWMAAAAVRNHSTRRPMWVNYAAPTFGLAVPVMVVGLVLWRRLDWWLVLVFVPFVAMRFFLFRVGSSVSRRNQG
jgi:hypothetical protein